MQVQVQHVQAAAQNRQQFFADNHGRPALTVAPTRIAADRTPPQPLPQRGGFGQGVANQQNLINQQRLQQQNVQNQQRSQKAMQVQNQIAQGQAGVAAQVGGAVSASQAAPGQTAAIQATNQLLATVTGQLTQLQALLITQARAEQTLAAQAQASQAAGAADSQRFWSGAAAPSRVQNPGKI